MSIKKRVSRKTFTSGKYHLYYYGPCALTKSYYEIIIINWSNSNKNVINQQA